VKRAFFFPPAIVIPASSMAKYVVKQLKQLHEHDQSQNSDSIRIAVFSFWIFHARLKRRAFPKPAVFGK